MKGLAYVKSSYSLLESNISIKQALAKAKDFDYEYLALVDTNNLHGVLDLIYLSRNSGVKTIIGLEVKIEDEFYQGKIMLYAHSQIGFKNLSNISTWKMAYENKITWEYLQNKKEGISLVLHPTNSPIHSLIFNDKKDDIFSFIEQIKESFERVYISCAILENKVLNNKLKKISELTNTSIILANPTLFIKEEDFIVPEILQSISKLKQANLDNDNYLNNYFFSPKEIKKSVDQELIDSTNKFFKDTWFYHEFKETKIPKFPSNKDNKELLKKICFEGLELKVGRITQIYLQRLEYELRVINKMEFNDYFLIVWDFIKFAKENKIGVGPGRGSVGGSLVAFALNITEINPIKHRLLFERFLNIDRISMPDIDIDFEDERRDEVINYVAEKYGKEHVSYISTFQTIGVKMSIRDIGRALGAPISQIDILSKYVPNKTGITIDLALEKSLNFKKEATKNLENQKIIKYAKLIEGVPRQLATHAAGILVSTEQLSEHFPLVKSKNSNLLQLQYSMHHLEKLGLIKIDFLGLRNLTTIKNVIKSIEKLESKKIDIQKTPLDDLKTYKLLSDATTEGIFQLESYGMKEVLKQMKPSNIEELGTTIALFRPGPMSNIPEYIARKNGNKKIIYLHPNLEEILKDTQGIIVYQEQIMQIATKIAGFPYSKSDILRRAMSKKKIDLMVKLEDEFISGAKNRGYEGRVAKEIYDLIYEFANYGFNSAHSISYAYISYQLAYLKANYPKHFLASLLSSNLGNNSKIKKYIQESYKLKIKMLKPSINNSFKNFTYEKQGVRFSLLMIKNVGDVAIKAILKERQENGSFKNFIDFVCRINDKFLSLPTYESLIMAGAFDEFGNSRKSLLKSINNIIRYAKLITKDGQKTLFKEGILPLPKISDVADDEKEMLENELSVLGVYLSSHPLTKIKEKIMDKKGKIRDIALLSDYNKTQKIAILGKITSLRIIQTKRKETMAFMSLIDDTGEVEAVLFPITFLKIGHKLAKEKIYCFNGVTEHHEGLKFIIHDAKNLTEIL